MNAQEKFQNWMVKKDKIQQGTSSLYAKAINEISQHYSENESKSVDIYKISELDILRNIEVEYKKGGKYEDLGKLKHNLYTAAIAKYIKFVEAKNLDDDINETPDIEINSQETISIKGINVPLYKSGSEKTQDFIKKILNLMFTNNLLPESEIKNMLSEDYCKKTFRIEYPIINKEMIVKYDQNRCWTDKIYGYYICSQWWKQHEETYKEKISNWIKKVKKINGGENIEDEVESQIDKPIKVKPNVGKQKLTSNIKHEILNRAFDFMLPVLPVYIGNILHEKDPNTWWQKYVLNSLKPNTVWDLPRNGTYEEYINKLDISLCIKIIIQNWPDIFKDKVKNIKFSWVHELIEIRNDVSHWSIEKSTNYTFEFISHTLSVMKLFMGSINVDVAEQISKIKQEFENKYRYEN